MIYSCVMGYGRACVWMAGYIVTDLQLYHGQLGRITGL